MATKKKAADSVRVKIVKPRKPKSLVPLAAPPNVHCQESSGVSTPYIAGLMCLRPAKFIIRNKDPKQYYMCAGCADHNVANRNAEYVKTGETFDIYVPENKVHWGDSSQEDEKPKGAPSPTDLPVGDEMLDYVRKGMKKFKEQIELRLAEMTKGDRPVSELARCFINIRAANGEIADAIKELADLDAKFKDFTLPEAFEREGVKSFTTDTDPPYRVTISTRFMASIKEGMKDEAFAWLRKQKMGDIIIEVVNASTLSATGKAMLEEGKELSETYFNTHYKAGASLVKVAKK